MLERAISNILKGAPPDSKQRSQAEALRTIYKALTADGFVDPQKEEVFGTELASGTQEGEIIYRLREFTYYPERQGGLIVGADGRKSLTTTENKIMRMLAEKPNRTVTYSELIRDVFYGRDGAGDLLKKYIERLRRKLEPNASKGNYQIIVNVRGEGYYLSNIPQEL